MNVFQTAVLGLVQGLAEFLPISSSGHLILARALMGISDTATESGVYIMLDILLHAGTLVAVLVVFWRDWLDILKNPFKSKTLLLLFIASIPALIAAVLLNDLIEGLFTGWFIGVSFLITAVFLLVAESASRRNAAKRQSTSQVGFKHAIWMGIMQAIALLPGVSRSGSTLTGGVLSKLNRQKAAKFSFMMSAPAILGSLLIKGKEALENGYFAQLDMMPTIVGMLVAALSGYLAIRFMLKLITKTSLTWFALYVAMVGLIVLICQLTGIGGLPPFALPAMG